MPYILLASACSLDGQGGLFAELEICTIACLALKISLVSCDKRLVASNLLDIPPHLYTFYSTLLTDLPRGVSMCWMWMKPFLSYRTLCSTGVISA